MGAAAAARLASAVTFIGLMAAGQTTGVVVTDGHNQIIGVAGHPLVTSGSGGGPITSPIGPQAMATSVSVTMATDQTPISDNLTQVGGAAISEGQKTMAASLPVVLASNQSAIPVTGSFGNASIGVIGFGVPGSGTYAAGNNGGALIGFTADASGRANSDMQAIGGASYALGQTTMAASAPVTIASNQSNLPENLTQVGGSALAEGQTTMANSVPVVIASNQSNLPENITQVGGAALALGQTTMAGGIPVSLASNQSSIPVTQSSGPWTQNLTQVGGAAISEGQTTMANSVPVVIASNQSGIPVTGNFSNGSVGLTGAAVPGSATYMGGNNGGTLTAPNVDTAGNLAVNISAQDIALTTVSAGDGIAPPQPALVVDNIEVHYNGTNYDRVRNNFHTTELTSASRTTIQQTTARSTFNARQVQMVVNVTVASGTGGLTPTLQGSDPVSSTWYNLTNVPTAIVGTGVYVYELGQNNGTATGGVTSRTAGMIPDSIRAQIAVGDASAYTYSVAFNFGD